MLFKLCGIATLVAAGRRFPPRGGFFGRTKKDGAAAAPAANATESGGGGGDVSEILKTVPVFCLSDDKGRPVLLQNPDATDAPPQQAFFTDFDIARMHAARIANETGNADLKLAVLDLGACLSAAKDAQDRVVTLLADPRELHAARQLVLRSAGYSNGTSGKKVVDFTSPEAIALACREEATCPLDLDNGVPLFSLKTLNATVRDKEVQPWFLSFADLVRAYVNSTEAGADPTAGLQKLLEEGGVAVATVDSLLANLRSGDAKRAFLLPPASSMAVMRAQEESAAPPAQPSSESGAAAMASEMAGASESGGGLFD